MIVRAEPGLGAVEVSRAPNGTRFVVAYGPVEADSYYWWRFESGGWAAGVNLRSE